jgi:hypothetical protein
MYEKVTIWSSVIVARLPEERICQQKSEFVTSIKYRRIEELKTRISSRQVKVEGKSVEIKVNVETLFILEDGYGNLQPFSRRDVIKERIPLVQFTPRSDNYQDLNYIAEIRNFYGDAILEGQNLVVIYYLAYTLLATREQMVTLQPEPIEVSRENTVSFIQPNHIQTEPLIAENIYLRRQLKLYETNLLSMKKSLQKAESSNAELRREIKVLQTGRTAEIPAGKDGPSQQGSSEKHETARVIPIPTLEERRHQMGKKIKEFFINNA